jgi:NifU-like protein involved in Fe-S cluster formation
MFGAFVLTFFWNFFFLIVAGIVDEAAGIKNRDIAKELHLPPVKLHCSMLAEQAIQAAVADAKKKIAAAAAGR